MKDERVMGDVSSQEEQSVCAYEGCQNPIEAVLGHRPKNM